GLSLHAVASEDQALRMLRVGQLAREVAEHQSHAVLTVHLTMRTIKKSGVNEDEGEHGKRHTEGEDIGQRGVGRGGGEKVTTSKLNLVDLAGSEKNATSETAGDAAILHREGSFINKSLTFLEQVTIALADQTREHVPFRSSRLTHFLKDSLGGNCRTLMVACIWPRPDLLQQSLATLKFAARMRCVKNDPVINERFWSAHDELLSLRGQVDQLKAQLVRRDNNPRHVDHDGAGAGDAAAADVATLSARRRSSRSIWEEVGRFVAAVGHGDDSGSSLKAVVSEGVNRRRAKRTNFQYCNGNADDSDGRTPTPPAMIGTEHDDVRHRHGRNTTETLSPGAAGECFGGERFCRRQVQEGEELGTQGVLTGRQRRRRRRKRRERLFSPPLPPSMPLPTTTAHSVAPQQQQLKYNVPATGHASEFCLALRELVWEAAAEAAEATRAPPSNPSESKMNDWDNNEGLIAAGGTGSRTTAVKPRGEGSRGGGGSAVATSAARSAIQAVLERKSSSKTGLVFEELLRGEYGSWQRGGELKRGEFAEQEEPAACRGGSSEQTGWGVTAAPVAVAVAVAVTPATGCEERFLRGDSSSDDVGNVSAAASAAAAAAGPGERYSMSRGSCEIVDDTVGCAPRSSSLPPSLDGSNINTDDHENGEAVGAAAHGGARDSAEVHCNNLRGDFERFKSGIGKEMNSRLQDVKAALRRACSLANDLAGRVNDAKGRIDSARAQLQHQQKQQQGRCEDKRGEGEKQEEESVKRVLLAQLKRQKREYRVLFEKLAEAKVDLQHLQQDKRKALAALAAEFQNRQEESIINSRRSSSTTSTSTSTTS
ncbi:unnamed protein product, partial [Pylaiella littoralis]